MLVNGKIRNTQAPGKAIAQVEFVAGGRDKIHIRYVQYAHGGGAEKLYFLTLFGGE